MAKITLDEAIRRPRTIDRAKLDATTEADIRRHQIEDGYDPEEEVPDSAHSAEGPESAIRQDEA